ncbi:MAG: hypothetical protein OHK0052_11530 [Anaerolineales bacterium]
MPRQALPDKARVYIPPPKLLDYLLSETHAVGKSKAKFFRSIGFNETTVSELEQGLLEIAQTGEVTAQLDSLNGTKYVIDGTLQTPRGIRVQLRTIWIVEPMSQAARFVTAYPIE